MAIQCPCCDYKLFEVAPKLFQCAVCGSGSSTLGSFPVVAFHEVIRDKRDRDLVQATAISFESGRYFIAPVAWILDGASRRGNLEWLEAPIEIPDKEAEDFALPVVIECEPHTRRPGTGIQKNMFKSPFGRKIVAL